MFGGSTFVDLDCWNPRTIFLCFEGLSVNAFSVAASSVEPSGLTDDGAYIIMMDLCLLLVLPVILDVPPPWYSDRLGVFVATES